MSFDFESKLQEKIKIKIDKWNKTLPFSYFVGTEGLGVAPHLQGGFVLVFKASGRSGSASPKTWPLLGSNTETWGGGSGAVVEPRPTEEPLPLGFGPGKWHKMI